MSARKLLLVLIAITFSIGCHARFKKFARTADAVSVNVVVTGSPNVDLVESGYDDGTAISAIADIATSTVASAQSNKVRTRLMTIMQPAEVQAMVKKGAVAQIGSGPPFATSEAPADGTIEIAVQSYGIVQSGGGPTFYVDYGVRGYRASDNKRVYNSSVSCSDRLFSVPSTIGNIAGTVATVDHLNKMSDEEIELVLSQVVQRCTGVLVAQMRRHAG